MKKTIISAVLGMGAVLAMFTACCEADTSFNQILWSGSWFLVSFALGKGSSKYIDKADREERV